MSLPAILAAARPTADGFVATIPAEWMQGRTSYGGLSSALALEAARKLADDLPPLRSATVNFVGPLAKLRGAALLRRPARTPGWALCYRQTVGNSPLGNFQTDVLTTVPLFTTSETWSF